MISIIVPVYNVEPYLHRCVDSLIAQTYEDIEIILVDDGSPDRCPEICDELALSDQRITVVHKQNGGLSSARNEGIIRAKGEYVCFVDSDDWVSIDYCKILIENIQNCDWTICSCKIVDRYDDLYNKPINTVILLECNGIWSEILTRLNNSSCNKLYRRSLLADIRFPVGLYHGEDLIFNLMYATRCNSASISSAELYYYYKHKGSVTNSKFSPRNFLEIKAKDYAFDIVAENKKDFINIAHSIRFRARLNVIRSIYQNHVAKEYHAEVRNISKELSDLFEKQRNTFVYKDIIEYLLLRYCNFIYRILLKCVS